MFKKKRKLSRYNNKRCKRAKLQERETQQEAVRLKLTNFVACETFHPLRSELKEVAPKNVPVYKDINLKIQKIFQF